MCKPYLSEAPDKANDILFLSADELNSVMREVRIFIEKLEVGNLPETALPALDLPASVRTIAGTLARLHGQQIRVSVDPAAASGLSHAQSLHIRNLVKEAISNSSRHARGTLVQFSLRQVKDGIRMTVRETARASAGKVRRKTVRGLSAWRGAPANSAGHCRCCRDPRKAPGLYSTSRRRPAWKR